MGKLTKISGKHYSKSSRLLKLCTLRLAVYTILKGRSLTKKDKRLAIPNNSKLDLSILEGTKDKEYAETAKAKVNT